MYKKTALVCDDDSNTCRLLFDILDNLGFCVSILRNGKETERVLSSFDKYDIAFVDIVMPKEYGTEAAELSEVFGNRTPIVFMSGLAILDQDEIKDHPFLAKPFTLEQLENIVKKVVQ